MRERMGAVGGSLVAGPTADGGFNVTARHPGGTDRSHRVTAPIRVVIVDDQQLVRVGFRRILETEPGIEVVGEAEDGAQASRSSAGDGRTSCSWTSRCR